jgi:predicted nucleic acid-binding protein
MTASTPYLLDTTALIDISKGFEPSRSKIRHLISRGDQLAVCSVSVAQFATGLSPSEREEWREFLASLLYWDLSLEAAFQAGIWRYDFSRRGIQLSTTDALIAATAWQHQATVITSNARHYPMAEVQLMSALE